MILLNKNSIVKNYIYNAVYKILVVFIPLITTPYLSRVLGAENIGIYSYSLSITTYFILFGSLGISMYGQREIAYIQNEKYQRSKAFFEILFMRIITLSISLLLFYFSFCLNGQYSVYYKILIFEIVANALDISWFFQGLEEFKKTVIRNTIVKLISVFCIFLFVKSSNDLEIYLYIYVLSNFIGNLSLWRYIPKYICKVNKNEINIFKHLKPTIGLFIPQVAMEIYTVLDKTMIGSIILDKSEVGFYEQAQKIVKMVLSIATSLGIVMMPRMSNIFASGNKEKLNTYINKSFSFVLLLAFPLMLGLISISNSFVPIYFGNGYDKVASLMIIISPIIVVIALSNIIGIQYMIPTKKQREFTMSVIIGALVNFLLNLILIKKYASIGASIATVIAEFAVTVTQFILVRKEIRFLDILKISYKYIIASIIMFSVSMVIGIIITDNLLSIVTQFVTSLVIYFIILIILKDKLILEGIDKIKSKIFKI